MQSIDHKAGEQILQAAPDEILGFGEASQYLGVSQAALRRWKKDGKAPTFFRAGKLLKFRKRDLDRWIDARMVTSLEGSKT